MLVLVFSVVVSLLMFGLGLATFISSRDKSAKQFGVLSGTVSFWILANHLGNNGIIDLDLRVILTKLDYSLGVLMTCVFLIFVSSFIGNKKMSLYSIKIFLPATGVIALLTLLNLVFKVLRVENEVIVSENVLFLPYVLITAGTALCGVAVLIKGYLESKDTSRKKLKLIVWGLSVAALVSLFSNVVLPILVQDRDTRVLVSYASYLSILLFIVLTWRAISKHDLFNFRDAAARTIVYLGSIISMLSLYLFVVYLLSGADLLSGNITTSQRVIYALIAVLSGLLFQPFMRFFDKVTNRLFFRDSYDSQVFIDRLNKHLVNSIELEELLTKVALILQENFKASFATFFIRSNSYFPDRIIGAHSKDPTDEDAEKIQELASKLHKKVIYVEKDSNNQEEEELIALLKKNDIEILVRIVSNVDLEVKGIGYIFMGSKKSGTSYNNQDLKVLEIVTNELILAIENVLRFEEIEQFNVTLQKKIDSATKELKSNNEKLVALDEAKDEFVSMASHQLRTPLTSIKGYISMVLEGDAGKISDSQRQMLGQALFSSQRMVYLISDLLNVSRLKTGKFLIEPKPVYLPDLVDSEVGQLHEGAKAKDLTLLFSKPKKFSTLELDEMKIRQVIMNFIDNAIYYTPNGGKITISLKETSKSVEFRVKDTGIGVPKAEKHKLFAKFYRADNARKARPDGTGLGLFMAKKVIVAQGGSIIFESSEGEGSTFGFSFPKDKLLSKQPE